MIKRLRVHSLMPAPLKAALIWKHVYRRTRQVIMPFLYCDCRRAPRMLNVVFRLVSYRKKIDVTQTEKRRATEMMQGLERMIYEERLREFNLCSLEKYA